MRPILFRWLKTYENSFAYGSLIKKRYPIIAEYYIQDEIGVGRDVVTETIGQFTGVYDRNGMAIYEGDVLDKMNLEFVGIELDKDYFDAAVKRIKAHQIQQTINF